MDRTQLKERALENLRAEGLVSDVTGAKRSETDVRYDLVPPEPIYALAHRFWLGANKYGDFNWRHGLTGKNSPLNHLLKHINEYVTELLEGKQYHEMSDDHLGAILWNAAAECFFRSHPEWYDERNRLRDHLELDECGIPRPKVEVARGTAELLSLKEGDKLTVKITGGQVGVDLPPAAPIVAPVVGIEFIPTGEVFAPAYDENAKEPVAAEPAKEPTVRERLASVLPRLFGDGTQTIGD